MGADVKVDLHCHSTFSDGQLTPEELVARLEAAGVEHAALCDHDTVEGLARFRAAAARRGIGSVSGLELTTHWEDREVHLLAYGFDPTHSELLETLLSIRQARGKDQHGVGGVGSFAHTLRQRSSADPEGHPQVQAAADHGRLATPDGIALVHRAGGKGVLAHPLSLERDPARLRDLVAQLRGMGLDGLEAQYAGFSADDRRALCDLADGHGLLVSGGADQHQADPVAPQGFGVSLTRDRWRAFRQAVTGGPMVHERPAREVTVTRRATPRGPRRLQQFALRTMLPVALVFLLFVVGIFALLLPEMEKALYERKREMIRELTNSAYSIMVEAEGEEREGRLTREAAQDMARTRIGAMRYGREGKDYFWLQDMLPRMVMHPYRPDLNGRDVSTFLDARGARIFVQFADLVRRKKEGYVEYVWQWKDDPRRLVAKESYIRGFEPWGWIIGTGIYIEDVKQEIARIEQGMVNGALAISVVVVLLLLVVVRRSLQLERQRAAAEIDLRDSNERYRSLVEAATEGSLLVSGSRCRYANPMLLEMLGYTARELDLLDLDDLLGAGDTNGPVREAIEQVRKGLAVADEVEGQLVRRDDRVLPCRIALRPLSLGGRSEFILLARPSSMFSHEEQRRALMDRLSQLPGDVTTDLTREVALAPDLEAVVACCRRTSGLVRSLLDCGAHPKHVTRLVASVCDAATARLVDLAIADLGPPPVPFAYVALGSQGRREQTLHTDQDSAIVFADAAANVDPASLVGYFATLGERVCSGLEAAGYPLCRGLVMASNPRWRQPLSVWQGYFDGWIDKAQPKELLEFGIFFDFRFIAGDPALVDRLRTHVLRSVQRSPDFFPHLAQNTLEFKPPLGLFGRIVTGGAGSDFPGMLDIKAAMLPIVILARLYALKHGVVETNTFDRLGGLAERGVLRASTTQEMQAAYESLMQLRLRHQVDAIQAGHVADNLVDPHALGQIERAVLRVSFAEIDAVQRLVNYEFLGGTGV